MGFCTKATQSDQIYELNFIMNTNPSVYRFKYALLKIKASKRINNKYFSFNIGTNEPDLICFKVQTKITKTFINH